GYLGLCALSYLLFSSLFLRSSAKLLELLGGARAMATDSRKSNWSVNCSPPKAILKRFPVRSPNISSDNSQAHGPHRRENRGDGSQVKAGGTRSSRRSAVANAGTRMLYRQDKKCLRLQHDSSEEMLVFRWLYCPIAAAVCYGGRWLKVQVSRAGEGDVTQQLPASVDFN
ncbi:hypothetical protein CCMA1212_005296, partial [Trichoderma ghanense]